MSSLIITAEIKLCVLNYVLIFIITLALSYYEIACTPRLINKTKLLEIKPEKIHKIIKEILTCNICLQIYNDPVNIKNCLHKFCRRCIEDFNRRM